jgi:hypothetical protein
LVVVVVALLSNNPTKDPKLWDPGHAAACTRVPLEYAVKKPRNKANNTTS